MAHFETFVFQNSVSDKQISVNMEGKQIISIDKAIKAVTYHNLEVEETTRGVEVVLVFDV